MEIQAVSMGKGNTAVSFAGNVDKRVIRYIDRVGRRAISEAAEKATKDGKPVDELALMAISETVEGIKDSLANYMAKTDKYTHLKLKIKGRNIALVFSNKKAPKGASLSSEGTLYNILGKKPFRPAVIRNVRNGRIKETLGKKDLEHLESFVEALKRETPANIDNLIYKRAKEQTKSATKLSLIGRIKSYILAKKTDIFASNIGKQANALTERAERLKELCAQKISEKANQNKLSLLRKMNAALAEYESHKDSSLFQIIRYKIFVRAREKWALYS